MKASSVFVNKLFVVFIFVVVTFFIIGHILKIIIQDNLSHSRCAEYICSIYPIPGTGGDSIPCYNNDTIYCCGNKGTSSCGSSIDCVSTNLDNFGYTMCTPYKAAYYGFFSVGTLGLFACFYLVYKSNTDSQGGLAAKSNFQPIVQ